MSRKRENVRQCKAIRQLIDDNKYTKALELIDAIPLEEVGSLDDLYRYAELYEKAERMDKKKEIFYAIYERTHSRHILYQLLRLVIRMGDMEEARELFLAYEVVGGITLDTYELRYRLARAEGEPRTRLIEILEDLKKEEYTEEWGYQLALLYEMEGERQKCIQECEDLKLWFGEGKIVDKAMELKARCEDKDWQPPAEEEIPEPVEPDVEETFAYAAPPVEVTELAEETETEAETAEDKEEESETETLSAKIPESLSEGVSEPVVTKKAEPLEVKPQRQPVEDLEAMLAEDPEDISERGIRYHTLKNTINHIKYEKKEAHFVFAGGEERITLAVAKRVAKELNHVGYFSAQSIVKINAEKLNGLNLAEQAEKLRGGCMLVTNAPELTKEAVEELIALIKDNGEDIVVMLSGPFDEMDCFLGIYPELSEILTYKVRM